MILVNFLNMMAKKQVQKELEELETDVTQKGTAEESAPAPAPAEREEIEAAVAPDGSDDKGQRGDAS